MKTTTTSMRSTFGDGIQVTHSRSNECAPYKIRGEHFNEVREALALMLKYHGACTIDPHKYASSLQCDYNCPMCDKSVYHQMTLQREAFRKSCYQLCIRTPKLGDEWEMSLIMKDGLIPKFQTFHFLCTQSISDESVRIVDVIYRQCVQYDPKLLDNATHRFVKIKRADGEPALDVSFVANYMLDGLAVKMARDD